MSEQENETLKRRFRTAQKLIAEERFDTARYVLQQIDHPQAREWLKRLEGKKSITASSAPVSGTMILFGMIAFLIVFGFVLAILYVPTLIEAIQPRTFEQYLDDAFISDEEMLYSQVAGYCYHITGYGGELCLVWAELLLAEHRTIINRCFEPFIEVAIVEADEYATIGSCLSESAIPPPY